MKHTKHHLAESPPVAVSAGPKFKVGDKVTVNGKSGVVVEVAAHDAHWLANEEQQYGVRLDERALKEDGTPADHEHDTLGCVPESALK